ncbi:MAG TPA: hypothetical protein PKH24_09795 [Sedimentisphaerales bacterium]|jgi:hypothetical protein|nr:hypothetical protein [Sedimentisphaerales bacterium]HNU28783.1 hypothetical protein [Sedimentisphaerales bacterium]
MERPKCILIAEEIRRTIERLHLRMRDRFPESNLANICRELYEISKETDHTVQWIARPNYLLRLGTYVLILIAVLAFVESLLQLNVSADGLNLADLVQMIDSGLNSLVLIGAGILFLVTLENRRKRNRVIHSVNRLRCIAHIVDMHQLTKDPDSIAEHAVSTPHSPRRTLGPYEMARYLDYCTEMLALVSKTGFLYVQDYHDPVATEAVNDLEDLTNGLSHKIWQKIMMLPLNASGTPLTIPNQSEAPEIPPERVPEQGNAQPHPFRT